jgi:hypothetical protein
MSNVHAARTAVAPVSEAVLEELRRAQTSSSFTNEAPTVPGKDSMRTLAESEPEPAPEPAPELEAAPAPEPAPEPAPYIATMAAPLAQEIHVPLNRAPLVIALALVASTAAFVLTLIIDALAATHP